MSVLKRLFCLILSSILLFLLCACSDDRETQENNTPKPQTITIEKEEDKIEIVSLSQEAAATPLAKKDFSGSVVTYYTIKQPTELQKLKLSAFSKAHNCSVKVVINPAGGMDEIAASIASGSPYDIVENDINSFSKTLFYNIYEPMQSSIDPLDFYSAERPEDLGLGNAFSSRFTINGDLLAVGSAESADFYILYYNRSLFNKLEYEDLQELWKTGKLSFEELLKMATVTSFVSGDTFLQTPSFSEWFNLKCVDVLTSEKKNFANNIAEQSSSTAATDYQNLIYGDIPICIPKSSKNSFKNGKAYCMIDKASKSSYWKDVAKNSAAFENNLENLGFVVLPFDISLTGELPVADVRCYSVLKGAKNPTAAACFALYESRSFEIEKTQKIIPDDMMTYLTTTFNNNGFIPNFNFLSKNGEDSIYEIIDDHGRAIMDGRGIRRQLAEAAPRINQLMQTAQKVKLPAVKK